MKIGVIGDDFTGSSDVGQHAAPAGARTLQYVRRAGRKRRAAGIDAAVIALKTRSAPAADAVAQSLAACRWLVAEGAEQIVFKYCSTFDSTRKGNIGPVAEALLDELGGALALVCPAFPANGRTIYQGHLFVGDRLLNESGMEKHPLTPMTDPDIRRVLAADAGSRSGICRSRRCARDAAGGAGAADGRSRLIVADAIDDADLLRLGRAAQGHRLVTGGSGIALGLPANFGIAPAGAPRPLRAARARPRAVGQLLGGDAAAGRGIARRTRRCGSTAEDALAPEAAVGRALAFIDGEPRRGADGLSRPPGRRGGGRRAGAHRARAAGGGLRGDLCRAAPRLPCARLRAHRGGGRRDLRRGRRGARQHRPRDRAGDRPPASRRWRRRASRGWRWR